jgi:hypothetical protein
MKQLQGIVEFPRRYDSSVFHVGLHASGLLAVLIFGLVIPRVFVLTLLLTGTFLFFEWKFRRVPRAVVTSAPVVLSVGIHISTVWARFFAHNYHSRAE